jgi:hypothetical protein
VVISTANGLKFSQVKTAYHCGGEHGFLPRYANTPVEIEAKLSEVLKTIEE